MVIRNCRSSVTCSGDFQSVWSEISREALFQQPHCPWFPLPMPATVGLHDIRPMVSRF